MNRQRKRGVYMHADIMGSYSAIKKNEVMLFAATWRDLEMITLREVGSERLIMYAFTSVESQL